MSLLHERPNHFPKGFELPSIEEAEQAVREGEKMIKRLAAARKGKLLRTDPDVRIVTINPHSHLRKR